MKIALLPYKMTKEQLNDEESRLRSENLMSKLVQYIGEIPLDTRVITDHYSASRLIALNFEAKYSTTTTIYSWLNPGARKRTNSQQFEHLITSMATLGVPLLILVVSATFLGSYTEQAIDILNIKSDRNLKATNADSIVIIDPDSNDKLKVISVA